MLTFFQRGSATVLIEKVTAVSPVDGYSYGQNCTDGDYDRRRNDNSESCSANADFRSDSGLDRYSTSSPLILCGLQLATVRYQFVGAGSLVESIIRTDIGGEIVDSIIDIQDVDFSRSSVHCPGGMRRFSRPGVSDVSSATAMRVERRSVVELRGGYGVIGHGTFGEGTFTSGFFSRCYADLALEK